MSLTSFDFVIFFVIVYAILWVIKGISVKIDISDREWNQRVLLIASYLFVVMVDWRFCVCMFALSVVTFGVGIQIENCKKKNKESKLWLRVGVSCAIIMLGVFKYFNFFATSICNLIDVSSFAFSVILPIGISFYTFSAISYLIDIQRDKYTVCYRFEQFALYIGFFPKLVSGPIVRADDFLKQLEEKRGVSLKNLEVGIQIFVFGMFKKVVLADHLGIFVDDVYSVPIAFDTVSCWLAAISYSLQIYFDFSGYSDMAIGIAKICGYDFKSNFNLPYVSKNLTEFWKRWHISLSSWLQEYVYYSLGGNRKGTGRTYLNLLLTMLIGGLWHGANWTFIAWGAIHGVGLVIHKFWMKCKRDARISFVPHVVKDGISVLCTFVIVTTCWIFFRAENFSNAMAILNGMFILRGGIQQVYSWLIFAIVVLFITTSLAISKSKKIGLDKVNGFYPILNLNKFWNLVVFFIFCGLTFGMGYFGNTAFIYGKF